MFQLDKWYLDCVADSGDLVILYRASLIWGPVRLHYTASLCRPGSGETTHRHSLRPSAEPGVSSGVVRWSCQPLDVSATWSSQSADCQQTLIQQGLGSIHWKCVSPAAEAEVCVAGVRVEGRGYVEHLTMTMKPWQLPINELRWGRYVGRRDSLVWIQWRGRAHRTWAWLDGTERQCVDVGKNRIGLPGDGILLDINGNEVVRSGSLNATVPWPIRPFGALIPGWRSARETKWLARGTLVRPERTDSGWVVHELVQWP